MQQFITSTVPTATYRFLVLGNFDVNYREVLDKLKSMDEKISVGWAMPTITRPGGHCPPYKIIYC
jgi:hypothetical protein